MAVLLSSFLSYLCLYLEILYLLGCVLANHNPSVTHIPVVKTKSVFTSDVTTRTSPNLFQEEVSDIQERKPSGILLSDSERLDRTLVNTFL